MHPPDFRSAAASDAELVQSISADAYVPAYQATVGVIPRPAFEDYAARIASGSVWLAELAGTVCGVLVLEEGLGFLMIYNIAVDPRHQGKGLGRALIAHAEQRAEARKVPELRLYTNRRMRRNVALYSSCGFVEVGERPHPSRPGEVLVDMVKMVGRPGPRTI